MTKEKPKKSKKFGIALCFGCIKKLELAAQEAGMSKDELYKKFSKKPELSITTKELKKIMWKLHHVYSERTEYIKAVLRAATKAAKE